MAFSGKVEDPESPGVTYTEPDMNRGADGKPLSESRLPERFAAAEYGLLIVAEKYQTGFDQPLLHTMYVDKRLAGIQAVQTLSRLNRTCPGKVDTFVLDFVNKPEEIYDAFKPYYEVTLAGDEVDPRQLYDLQAKLNECHVYHIEEVDDFCAVFFKAKAIQTPTDHKQINTIVDRAVTRFKALEEASREEIRALLSTFRNLYSFLSQVIPYQDSDLEKLYTYARFLLSKLPRRPSGPKYDFDDEVSLKFYRLEKIGDGTIPLGPGANREVKGPTDRRLAAGDIMTVPRWSW